MVPVNRIGFRPFLNKISEGQKVDILIDTNALIALGEELHPNHEEVTSFILNIDTYGFLRIVFKGTI